MGCEQRHRLVHVGADVLVAAVGELAVDEQVAERLLELVLLRVCPRRVRLLLVFAAALVALCAALLSPRFADFHRRF